MKKLRWLLLIPTVINLVGAYPLFLDEEYNLMIDCLNLALVHVLLFFVTGFWWEAKEESSSWERKYYTLDDAYKKLQSECSHYRNDIKVLENKLDKIKHITQNKVWHV